MRNAPAAISPFLAQTGRFLASQEMKMDEYEGFPEDVRVHLAEQGSDLSLPHSLDLYLYYPSEAAAQEVAAFFMDSPMETDVSPSDQHWLCLVQCHLVPSTNELTTIAELMRTIHEKFGGDFDGWHAEIVLAAL